MVRCSASGASPCRNQRVNARCEPGTCGENKKAARSAGNKWIQILATPLPPHTKTPLGRSAHWGYVTRRHRTLTGLDSAACDRESGPISPRPHHPPRHPDLHERSLQQNDALGDIPLLAVQICEDGWVGHDAVGKGHQQCRRGYLLLLVQCPQQVGRREHVGQFIYEDIIPTDQHLSVRGRGSEHLRRPIAVIVELRLRERALEVREACSRRSAYLLHGPFPVCTVREPDEPQASSSDARAWRLLAKLIRVASTVSLVLVLAGIYSVRPFTVYRRTREIGIRVAMGAEPPCGDVDIFRRPLGHVFAGVVVGWLLVAGLMAVLTGSVSAEV